MAALQGPHRPRHPADQGRRYSWGYPAVPDQSEHLKVEELLDLGQIGMSISAGFAPEPEQSTLAIVAHHPDATYFGMKSGRLPTSDRQRADDVIAGTDRDPTRLAELTDADPTRRRRRGGGRSRAPSAPAQARRRPARTGGVPRRRPGSLPDR